MDGLKDALWWPEFDGGALNSDAGGLLLGAAEGRLNLIGRLAGCFRDTRDPRFVEHSVATLVGQRMFGIALGCEDLNDHDDLRHDPVMAVLAGKLEARREDCAPVAGKSTLNRLEFGLLPVAARMLARPSATPAAFEKCGLADRRLTFESRWGELSTFAARRRAVIFFRNLADAIGR